MGCSTALDLNKHPLQKPGGSLIIRNHQSELISAESKRHMCDTRLKRRALKDTAQGGEIAIDLLAAPVIIRRTCMLAVE